MHQPTPGGSGSSSGTATTTRTGGGLARFRSAPATWLEALLEEDDEGEEGVEDSLEALKPTESLTRLLSSSSNPINYIPEGRGGHGFDDAGGASADLGVFESSNNAAFLRQNSSPAELFGGGYDGFFANSGQDYLSTPPPALAKRVRDPHQSASAGFSPQLKGEQSGGGQFQDGGVDGYLDLEMDKLLEDSVPCRVRAKRGCATHPRSIAERVRRTRISDRIRKLQDLVPNMDKQTNTADMLDEAVEYVKYLQKQIKELTDHQKNCKCSSKEDHQ